MRHHLRNTLSHKDVWTYARGERIIATSIAYRLLHPEVVTEYGIEIHATLQGFERPAMIHIPRPRDEVLLQCERHLGIVRLILGHESHKQVGFPLSALAVIPTNTYGDKTHIATELQDVLRRNQARPTLTIIMYALVITRKVLIVAISYILRRIAINIHQRVATTMPGILCRRWDESQLSDGKCRQNNIPQ